ncbi:MAG TPA: ZIP family metal transporter [Candidatus Saccharimonadales bacterium]|nr:ZIP family metal transporter [Candidatus Saccharimonadales bacterium]
MDAFLLSIIAALGALVGGFIALNSRRHLYKALGFTAGVILGLVAFDLLPEIFKIINSTSLDSKWPMIALCFGFLFMHVVEKLILFHHAEEQEYGPHVHPYVGFVSAIALAGHSFLDGVAIGLAFQVNSSIGTTVAIAVIAHRFADGFNTTNVMLYNKNQPKRARQMLMVAAAMPILGALFTQIFSLSEKSLAIYLGFFAGFLLYIGASEILPQAHSKKSSRITIGLTVLGTVFMFIVTRLA